MPNWNKIREEWETTKLTFKALAEKHDVKEATLKSRRSREDRKDRTWYNVTLFIGKQKAYPLLLSNVDGKELIMLVSSSKRKFDNIDVIFKSPNIMFFVIPVIKTASVKEYEVHVPKNNKENQFYLE